MNALEISNALQDHSITKNTFRGVFPSDKVPDFFDVLPGACVVNTHSSQQPGEHWIALYQDVPDVIEFFDSFGQTPAWHNLHLHIFSNKTLIKQDNKLQSDITTVCGQYTMFFILQRCSGISFSNIIRLFSNNPLANDKLVRMYVNREFRLKTPLLDANFLFGQ